MPYSIPSLSSQAHSTITSLSSFYERQPLWVRVGSLVLVAFAILRALAYLFRYQKPTLEDRIHECLRKNEMLDAWYLIKDLPNPSQKEAWIDELFPQWINYRKHGFLEAFESAKATLDPIRRTSWLQAVAHKWLDTKNFTAIARRGFEIPGCPAILQAFCEEAINKNALQDAYQAAVVYLWNRQIQESLFRKLYHQARHQCAWDIAWDTAIHLSISERDSVYSDCLDSGNEEAVQGLIEKMKNQLYAVEPLFEAYLHQGKFNLAKPLIKALGKERSLVLFRKFSSQMESDPVKVKEALELIQGTT